MTWEQISEAALLWNNGLDTQQIADKLKVKQPAVHSQIERIREVALPLRRRARA